MPKCFALIHLCLSLGNVVAATLADQKAEMRELTEKTSHKEGRKSQKATETPAGDPTRSIPSWAMFAKKRSVSLFSSLHFRAEIYKNRAIYQILLFAGLACPLGNLPSKGPLGAGEQQEQLLGQWDSKAGTGWIKTSLGTCVSIICTDALLRFGNPILYTKGKKDLGIQPVWNPQFQDTVGQGQWRTRQGLQPDTTPTTASALWGHIIIELFVLEKTFKIIVSSILVISCFPLWAVL